MKNKRKKQKKLSSLILLLLLSVVLLGTSTYAWFTSNKNVSIEGIDVKVTTSSGLLISADATTWKTTLTNVDLSGATWTGVKNQLPGTITNTTTGKIMDVNETGALDMYDGEVTSDAGVLKLSTSKAANEANGSSGNYVAFDVFFKTETAGQIYLTTAANVTNDATSEDKGLKNASRVAFVKEGSTSADAATSDVYALNGATEADVVVWEPNYDTHTSYGVTQASSVYGINDLTAGAGNAKLAYKGVKAVVEKKELTYEDDNYVTVDTIGTLATPTAYTAIFSLEAGITKMRVYFWVEGQDIDCENNASGTGISLNIALSQNSSAE
jgi:predicted ribosomally synthesized peptide with SipW-like signal peptide